MKLSRRLDEITQYCCWAHARRYFHRARHLHPKYSEAALHLIGKLYKIERELREGGASNEERVRKRESAPVLEELKTFLTTHPTVEKCPWHIAVHYTLKRWEQLTRFVENGAVEIDNNLIENRIRPIALGRKNYLFAGSHDAAERAGIFCSIPVISIT